MPTDYASPTTNLSTLDVTFWFITIVLLVILLLLLYFWLNRSFKRGPKTKEVTFIKKYYLERSLYVGILKIFDEYYLVVVSTNSFQIIRKFEEYEVNNIIGEKSTFLETFSKMLKKDKNIREGNNDDKIN